MCLEFQPVPAGVRSHHAHGAGRDGGLVRIKVSGPQGRFIRNELALVDPPAIGHLAGPGSVDPSVAAGRGPPPAPLTPPKLSGTQPRAPTAAATDGPGAGA